MYPYPKPPDVTGNTGRGDAVRDGVEDPIADAVLSGSTYQRLRVRRPSLFSQPVPQRLGWQAATLGALALVAPLWMTAPDQVRAAAGAAASPTVLVVGLFAVATQVLGAAGHVATALVRLRAEELDERTARRLLAAEDASSLVGLATGGFATAVTVGYFALGRLDPETVAAVVESGGGNPFSPSGLGVSVPAVAGAALAAAALCIAASHALDAALPET